MEGRNQEEQNDQKIHHPEFVFISEEYKESVSGGEHQFRSSQYSKTFEKLHDVKASFPLRIACLIASLVMFVATLFGVILTLVFLSLVLGTLGQVKGLNRFAKNYWSTIRKVFVAALGLFIAVFSPAFGLGVIVLYFILVAGGTSGDPVFSKFFESRLYKG